MTVYVHYHGSIGDAHGLYRVACHYPIGLSQEVRYRLLPMALGAKALSDVRRCSFTIIKGELA